MPVTVLACGVLASHTRLCGAVLSLAPGGGQREGAVRQDSAKGTLMQELRLVAVSEDGSYAVLVVPGRSGRFALPIDERLRTVAKGQFSRLAQYEIEVESPLRPKEIQDRIRAGETAEEIADAAGLPVDRIRRFEGPPLAERARWAQEAQRATVRGGADSGPGPGLGDVVADRLADLGANADEVEWDSRKRQDGTWQVQLAYTVGGRMHMAEWVYDIRSRHATPDDDEAIRLCLDPAQWPEPRQPATRPATATVTPIGSRSGLAAGHPGDDRDADWPGRAVVHPSRHASAPLRVAAATGQAPAGQMPASHLPAGQVPAGQLPAGQMPAGIASREPGSTLRESPAAGDGAPSAAGMAAPGIAAPGPARETAAPGPAPETAAPGPAHETAEQAAVPSGRPEAAGLDQVDGGERSPAAVHQGVPDPAPEPPAAPPASRPAKRTAGRSRRSSVPSWDEIMFGNSRQPD